jgi:hypothetical protein
MSRPIQELFNELGDAIQSRWRAHSFDENRLPALAVEELERHQLHEAVTLEDLSALMFQTNAEARVPVNETFGDAAVTVYRATRFFIEALLWTDGTTSIHQHSFGGAFTVLCGGSFHGRYDFEPRERVNASMSLGDLKLQHTELLRRGDVRAIDAGPRFIHNLFHLESPSITLVVRTYRNRESEPQLAYLPPGLANDTFFKDPVLTHQTRYVKMLVNLEHPIAGPTLREYLTTSDLHSTYRTLDNLHELLFKKKLWDQALDWVRERHGTRIDWLEGAFNEIVRRNHIIGRRRLIRDAELRFFLAMLLNVPTLSRIRQLTEARFPETNANDQLISWIAKVLDAHNAEYTEGNLDIIRYALEKPADEYVISRLKETYEEQDVDEQLPVIQTLCQELRQNLMFKSLFQN